MGYNIFDAAKDLVTGNLKFASNKVVELRAELCRTCEVNVANICTACGCVIPAKIKLAESSCPMELWMEEV